MPRYGDKIDKKNSGEPHSFYKTIIPFLFFHQKLTRTIIWSQNCDDCGPERLVLWVATDNFELNGFPFFDIGYVWNTQGRVLAPQTLVGTGVGVRLSYKDLLLIQTNYGFALNDSEGGFEDITQGLSFSVLGRLKF